MGKTAIKKEIDVKMFQVYNIFSNIGFVIKKYKYKEIFEKNKELKNIHKGERCFILGTGPSLNSVNLKLLQNEIVFGVNFLYKGVESSDLDVKYYCLYDPEFNTKKYDAIEQVIDKWPDVKVLMGYKAYDVFEKNLQNHIYYQYANLYQYNDFISCDMEKNVTASYNVINGAIQSAIYMGFNEIYLLGCDFNSFIHRKEHHYYDSKICINKTMSMGLEMEFYSKVAFHHYALSKYAEQVGVKIWNSTCNSLLDAYEFKDLGDIQW